MDDMNITSAQYLTLQQDTILAVIDGTTWSVPLDPANIHYAAILEWVADGNTITAAGG
tara:strand:+ start:346 stop:519 length:174 start_codon:yes stop_codon:yes gene_type:complete